MTEKIIQFVKENLALKGHIFLSKFHHGRASQGSKVLFLATCCNKPVCILKIVRSSSANEKLKKEKKSQQEFVECKKLSSPKIYFDGVIEDMYIYGEEVVEGKPLSKDLAYKKEKEILNMIRSFSFGGKIPTKDIVKIFLDNIPEGDSEALRLIEQLNRKELFLERGFSHGDLTRKNIINSKKGFRLIDWERAGDRPLRFIDGIHFMVSLRNIKNKKEWERETVSLFVQYTGLDVDIAKALYYTEVILEIFCKKYPSKYKFVVRQIS